MQHRFWWAGALNAMGPGTGQHFAVPLSVLSRSPVPSNTRPLTRLFHSLIASCLLLYHIFLYSYSFFSSLSTRHFDPVTDRTIFSFFFISSLLFSSHTLSSQAGLSIARFHPLTSHHSFYLLFDYRILSCLLAE